MHTTDEIFTKKWILPFSVELKLVMKRGRNIYMKKKKLILHNAGSFESYPKYYSFQVPYQERIMYP